jgi:3-oxoacyl-[acyl-carrier protein] reductase
MVCLITGSSRGLGKAIALALGRRGHRIVIHYRDKKREAEEAASQIKESMVLQTDVRNFSEVKSLVDEAVKQWGGIDVLVNNAGITKEALFEASEMTSTTDGYKSERPLTSCVQLLRIW